MKRKLNCAVIGCGNIGALFDINAREAALPLTHAGAYAKNRHFDLTACIDSNPDVLKAVKRKFKPHFVGTSINDLSNLPTNIDVVSICSPSGSHFKHLTEVIHTNPKLIFCEKPLTSDVEQSKQILKLSKRKRIGIAVNYSRRWDHRINVLKTIIQTNTYGDLRSISASYNKGLMNNGSHMLDMLHHLFGRLKILGVGRPTVDWNKQDPSRSMLLETETKIPITIGTTDARDYSHFECTFAFSNCLLSMHDGGLYWIKRSTRKSAIYASYDVAETWRTLKGTYLHCMKNAVNNLYSHLEKEETLLSTAKTAFVTQQFCEQIEEYGKQGKIKE